MIDLRYAATVDTRLAAAAVLGGHVAGEYAGRGLLDAAAGVLDATRRVMGGPSDPDPALSQAEADGAASQLATLGASQSAGALSLRAARLAAEARDVRLDAYGVAAACAAAAGSPGASGVRRRAGHGAVHRRRSDGRPRVGRVHGGVGPVTSPGRRALAVAVVLGALGPFAAAASAQPPVDPDGSATRWSFDYVQAAVDDLVNDPLPAAYGGVTVRQYFYDMGVRLWAAIALIMVVVQGLKVSMGGRLDMWGLVSFLLWIAFPLMVLEGFYTPYAAFGDQTFIQMVTGQGQALASALNEGGGAFSQLHDRVYAVLSETFRQFGIALSNAPWSPGNLLLGLDALIGTLISLSVAASVLVLGIVLLLIASLLVYTQVVWANVALGVLTLLGPIFVPFLLVEQMSFLFLVLAEGAHPIQLSGRGRGALAADDRGARHLSAGGNEHVRREPGLDRLGRRRSGHGVVSGHRAAVRVLDSGDSRRAAPELQGRGVDPGHGRRVAEPQLRADRRGGGRGGDAGDRRRGGRRGARLGGALGRRPRRPRRTA